MSEVEKRNHWWAFVIVAFLTLLSFTTYAMNEYYVYLVAYLWFGFVYGMCLQYGRFCFSSAFRDLFAVGVPRMAVGIMIAMVLFGTVSAFVTATGNSTFHAAPYGIHSVIAASSSASAWCSPAAVPRARSTRAARATRQPCW